MLETVTFNGDQLIAGVLIGLAIGGWLGERYGYRLARRQTPRRDMAVDILLAQKRKR